MLNVLKNLDRRWVFLSMLLAVAIPILLEVRFPEQAGALTKNAFDIIDNLPRGSKVLLSFDYDPSSGGELTPMATAFTRHCALKGHKMYFMALWPVGPQMVTETIAKVITPEFPDLKYGRDFVNLGYKSGYEAVIKVIVTDLKQLYTTDNAGTAINNIEMMRNVRSLQDMDLIITVSAGYAGAKEWVQYAKTAFPDKITVIAGCTGVQAPPLYPYIPNQLPGMLAAIKGAAEYENLILAKYPAPAGSEGKYEEGLRRMGPQLVAHLLMIGLIVLGNLVFFMERKRRAQR